MTLHVPQPTEESVETVRSHLSALASRTAFRNRALTRANPAGLALAAPHNVYSLGLSDLAGGVPLEAAKLVALRFIVMDGDKPIASAELADDLTGFQASEGRLVQSTATAIEHAEADSELGNANYEVRLLRIPALYFTALWLKNQDGGMADVVTPLNPAPAPFEAGRKYGPAEILVQLAEVARARLDNEEPFA